LQILKKHLLLQCAVLLLGFLLIAFTNIATAKPTQNDVRKIETTVKQFWKAIGELDANALKQTVDYPFTIAEETAEHSSSDARINIIQDASEVDKEFMRSNPSGEKRRGEFYGVVLLNLKIQILNDGLAYASYYIQLSDQGLKKKSKAESKPFALLTVLKRENSTAAWRIVFTNIPR
jgi:hypothetical protein